MILYTGTKNASSWAFRAWLALREAQVSFEEVVVDIRRPQRFENLARIAAFSPPGAVPVLVANETVIYDSLAIMEYANDLAGGALLPAAPLARAHARSLMAWVHSGMSQLCCNISFESAFHANKRGFCGSEHQQAIRVFDVWQQELASSGGPFLLGALSLADLAFVPVVVRLLSRSPDMSHWPLVDNWFARLMALDSVAEWMTTARSLPPVAEV
jgi:glutathione S-transferase